MAGSRSALMLAMALLMTPCASISGRAEDYREHAMAEQAKVKPDPVSDFYQGGEFCGIEFDGDGSRTWK